MINLKAPLYVNFEVTNNCNLKCKFCYAGERKAENFYSLEHHKEILDRLREADVFEVNFFGGEPTLYPYLKELFEYAYDIGLFTGIVSNCYNISEKIIDVIKETDSGIGISIHSCNPEKHDSIVQVKGAWFKTIESLKKIREKGIPVTLNFTAIKSNYREIYEYIKFFVEKFDVQNIAVNRFFESGSGKKYNDLALSKSDIKELAELMKKASQDFKVNISFADMVPLCVLGKEYKDLVHKCNAGFSFCAITPNGDVKICPTTEMVVGNIFKESLTEIWNSETLKEFRKFDWLCDKCKKCPYFKDCEGGCYFSDPRTNDRIYNVDYLVGCEDE